LKQDEVKKGGIIISPIPPRKSHKEGKVVALARANGTTNGKLIPFEVKVGRSRADTGKNGRAGNQKLTAKTFLNHSARKTYSASSSNKPDKGIIHHGC